MIYLLVYIHQKKKIELEIAAKIANVNVPLGKKKNMWVSGFPTLPSFWTSKSRP
jgi:hypothetical protein